MLICDSERSFCWLSKSFSFAENNPSICVSKSFCDFVYFFPDDPFNAVFIMTLRKFDVHSMKAWLEMTI